MRVGSRGETISNAERPVGSSSFSTPQRVEMMHRSMAGADLELPGGGDGIREIGFCSAHRCERSRVLRQQGGDGGGKRAAGAVRVLCDDACGGEFHLRGAVVEEVDALRPFEMTALQQHVARAKPV